MTADFKTLDISDMSLDIWNQIISDHLNAKYKIASELEKIYIRINTAGQFALFDSKKTAKEFGFDKNIPVSKMIEITSKKIDQDPSGKYQAQFRMKILLHQKLAQLHHLPSESSSVFKLFSPSKKNRDSQLKKLQDEVVEVQAFLAQLNPLGDIITPKRLTFISEELQKAESSLELKLYPNPASYIYADRFFQLFNFQTPGCCCLSRKSEVGKLAFKKLKFLGSSDFKQRLQARKESFEKIEEEKKQFKELLKIPYISAMRKVEGTRFTDLSQKNANALFSNQSLLKILGQIIFLDCFIGNPNRISLTECNLENFLLTSDSKIALIGQQYSLDSKTFDQIAQNISQLLDRTTGAVSALVAQLKEKWNFKLTINMESVEDKLFEGIIEGAHSLMNNFSYHAYRVYAIHDVPPLFNQQFPELPDPESFFKMLTHVSQMLTRKTKEPISRSSSKMNISPSKKVVSRPQ